MGPSTGPLAETPNRSDNPKFNRRWHGVDEAQQACANSLERLGLDRIDLLLIHWPNPEQDRYVDAWRGMQQLLVDGRVRAIGVSNFAPSHLERLADETGVMPHLNQIQLDPRIGRATERAYHAEHGIVKVAGNLNCQSAIVERLRKLAI